jgi:ATP-dependent DNA helicase RecG
VRFQVAAIMLLALDNGFQACLMAPTEILANQHFIGLSELANELNINIKIYRFNQDIC